jgi:acetyltransferase-like isoleucine patch superfamily enzyme
MSLPFNSLVKCIRKAHEILYSYLDPIGYARSIGVRVGKDCRLIGVHFGSEPFLVTLGDHVSAADVSFITHDGGIWVFRDTSPEVELFGPITVGNNVFLGAGVRVLPGATIGDNVIVGAGAVVVGDIPSNCVAVGLPAKPIRTLKEYWARNAHRLTYVRSMPLKAKREYLMEHFNLSEKQRGMDGDRAMAESIHGEPDRRMKQSSCK